MDNLVYIFLIIAIGAAAAAVAGSKDIPPMTRGGMMLAAIGMAFIFLYQMLPRSPGGDFIFAQAGAAAAIGAVISFYGRWRERRHRKG
jgi:uncharacterized membrane protein YccC